MLGMPLDNNFSPEGFNYGSPTVNYVMGGMNNIPPNPIGNTLNIGGQGYNNYNPTVYQQPVYYDQYGQMQYQQPVYANQPMVQQYSPYQQPQPQVMGYNSYYGQPQPQVGGYNSYYGNYNYAMNPYLVQQQQKAAEAAYKEQMRQQTDMFKTVSRMMHRSVGDMDQYEDFEGYLDQQYNPVEIPQETYEEERRYNKLANLVPVQSGTRYIENCARISEMNRQKYPEDMNLHDFLGTVGETYVEALIARSNAANRNGKQQYDSNRYREIVESHRSSSSYFNSLLTGGIPSAKITIDDMEIELPSSPNDSARIVVNCPSHLQEYAARKQAFLDTIMKNAAKI